MDQQTGFLILLFVILSLLTGSILRHFLKNIALPYTIALLLLGLGLGFAQRGGMVPAEVGLFGHTLELVTNMDPHLIMFLFLPTLIFESAFAMEVHLFRRTLLQIAILAVPSLLVSTILTATLAKYLFPWNWSWTAALLFGSLISATDPVAVVALLKELSSRKRLETLLEGESLLNDGTAIVLFTLFYHLMVGESQQELSWSLLPGIGWQFLWGVSMGLLVGLFFGGLAIIFLGKIYKDAMVEITLSITVAYLAFLTAESIFHVSGVVAVVTLALLLAGIGRTRISPEIAGFLHHFWKVMAYLANTLIFLLVGLIIALRVQLDQTAAWKALLLFFGGILLIRAGSILLFLPLLRRIGIGITIHKATVLIWGGLRGAVALTMALIITQDQRIATEFGNQVLFMTAGIVVLTLLINGTTMPLVLRWLGLNSLPTGKQATVDQARTHIVREMNELLPLLRQNRFFQRADWQLISATILAPTSTTPPPLLNTTAARQADIDCEFKRRLLEAERKQYWLQFQQGLLGGAATNILVDAVERALDEEPTISPRPLLYKLWDMPLLFRWLERVPLLNRLLLSISFDRLALGYDVARGFIHAMNSYPKMIELLDPSPQSAEEVQGEVLRNKRIAYERIEQLRQAFPEVIIALETRAASRSLLNRQRATIEGLLDDGLLDKAEADKMFDEVETRLKQLHQTPTKIEVPPPRDILERAPWLEGTAAETRQRLQNAMEVRIYHKGEVLYHHGEPDGSLALLVRGAVEQLDNQAGEEERIGADILGPGTVLGVYTVLTGKNDATIRCLGPVEIIWFNRSTVHQLLRDDRHLLKNLNILYDDQPLS
ncbi:cation:proton antiporter domain-containing protein [Desulfogranum mediterraneum]|uniref:cation:proton antiporter domain-containing protein n=1 Tax=Desulfogranum mediterraneum TaxID=160661 RepID=UPI00040D1885|nr:cation:proton antiporter [Desulfogranum mediterraneum]